MVVSALGLAEQVGRFLSLLIFLSAYLFQIRSSHWMCSKKDLFLQVVQRYG